MCALDGQEKFVFANSELYKKGMQCTLFPDWKKEISEVQVVLVATLPTCM